jgi:uncharacterized protein YjbI with pentapeptide repeats
LFATSIDFKSYYSTLTAADFSHANLEGAVFQASELTSANFTGANLANVNFRGATAYGARFDQADMRGADFSFASTNNSTTANAILSDGRINGLDLTSGKTLNVRDYDGDPARSLGPISISIQQHFSMSGDGTLQIVFEEDAWDSTISFTSGIAVALGGTLNLTFASGVDLSAQIGRTFSLFNWTGVEPAGEFHVTSPYRWDLSRLYTTGEVTLRSIPLLAGDFDSDGDVDGADFVAWQTHVPRGSGATLAQGDADGDGDVDGADFIEWQTNAPFTPAPAASPVPEPASVFMFSSCAIVMTLWRIRRFRIK